MNLELIETRFGRMEKGDDRVALKNYPTIVDVVARSSERRRDWSSPIARQRQDARPAF